MRVRTCVAGGLAFSADAEAAYAVLSAVKIGSAGLINPHTYSETSNGMSKWAEDQDVTTISEVVGSFRAP